MSIPAIQDAIDLIEGGRPSEAIPLLAQWAQQMPTYVALHVVLAHAYEAVQQWDDAHAAWQRAHFLMPNSPAVQEGIARFVVETATEPEPPEAERLRMDLDLEAELEATLESISNPLTLLQQHDIDAVETPSALDEVDLAIEEDVLEEDVESATNEEVEDEAILEEGAPVEKTETKQELGIEDASDEEAETIEASDIEEEVVEEVETIEEGVVAEEAALVEKEVVEEVDVAEEVATDDTLEATDFVDVEEGIVDEIETSEAPDIDAEIEAALLTDPVEEAATEPGDITQDDRDTAEVIEALEDEVEAATDLETSNNVGEENSLGEATTDRETDEVVETVEDVTNLEAFEEVSTTDENNDALAAARATVEVADENETNEHVVGDDEALAQDESGVLADRQAFLDNLDPGTSQHEAQETAPASEVGGIDFDEWGDFDLLPETESASPSEGDLPDLDRLIDELQSARIVPHPTLNEVDPPDLDDEIDDMVSETLAKIYASQQKYHEAARVYDQLALQQPDQADAFHQQANELRALAGDQDKG